MIKKMIHKNCNKTVDIVNDSQKRINYISRRIKLLENDINQIKKKENLTSFSPTTINNESSTMKDNIYALNFSKNNTLYNDNSLTNFSKKQIKSNNKRIFNLINKRNTTKERKNIKLKLINHEFDKNNNQRNKNSLKYRPTSDNPNNKIRHFFSFNRPFKYNLSLNIEDENEINLNNNYKSNRNKLAYEFEIRNLKRKIISLKKENKVIQTKLNNIKNINLDIEKDIQDSLYQQQKQGNIINDLILLNERYQSMVYTNQTEVDNNQKSNLFFENIVLNVMDIKYFYENHLLIDEFIEGVNKLIKNTLLFKNSENFHKYNILKKINEIIDIKNNLENNINKYKYLSKDNYKYYFYYMSLLSKLNLNNYEELIDCIKKVYIDNIKENHHLKKIQNTLMDVGGSSAVKKDKFKKRHYSSNRLLNSLNQKNGNTNYNRIQNYVNNKYSDSKLRQKTVSNLINNKRKMHNFTKKDLFRPEPIDNVERSHIINVNINDSSFYKMDKKNNSLFYSIKSANSHYNKKRRKININNFNNNNNRTDNYNGGKKIMNKYDNKTKLMSIEDDINEERYSDKSNKNNSNKIKSINNFKNNFVRHFKNHSVIIFDK